MADTPGTGGMDRRSLLKKGAAAGAVVWAAPAVTSLSQAHAQAAFTNCFPRASFQLIRTGPNCDVYEANANPADPTVTPSCCNAQTYAFVFVIDCGDTCNPVPGTASATILSVEEGDAVVEVKNGCKSTVQFVAADSCDGENTVVLKITYSIACEDGSAWDCTEYVRFEIGNCPDVAPGLGTNGVYPDKDCKPLGT